MMKKSPFVRLNILCNLLYIVLAFLLISFVYRGPLRHLISGKVETKQEWVKNDGSYFPVLALCPLPGFKSGFFPNNSYPGTLGDAFEFEELGISATVINSSLVENNVDEREWVKFLSSTVSKGFFCYTILLTKLTLP